MTLIRLNNLEDECRNGMRLPWSKEINEIMTQFHILKIQLSNLLNRINSRKQTAKKQNCLRLQLTCQQR